MCYTRRKIEGGVGALEESDDTNFLKPNGQSRNLNIYGPDQGNRPTDGIRMILCWIIVYFAFEGTTAA